MDWVFCAHWQQILHPHKTSCLMVSLFVRIFGWRCGTWPKTERKSLSGSTLCLISQNRAPTQCFSFTESVVIWWVCLEICLLLCRPKFLFFMQNANLETPRFSVLQCQFDLIPLQHWGLCCLSSLETTISHPYFLAHWRSQTYSAIVQNTTEEDCRSLSPSLIRKLVRKDHDSCTTPFFLSACIVTISRLWRRTVSTAFVAFDFAFERIYWRNGRRHFCWHICPRKKKNS